MLRSTYTQHSERPKKRVKFGPVTVVSIPSRHTDADAQSITCEETLTSPLCSIAPVLSPMAHEASEHFTNVEDTSVPAVAAAISQESNSPLLLTQPAACCPASQEHTDYECGVLEIIQEWKNRALIPPSMYLNSSPSPQMLMPSHGEALCTCDAASRASSSPVAGCPGECCSTEESLFSSSPIHVSSLSDGTPTADAATAAHVMAIPGVGGMSQRNDSYKVEEDGCGPVPHCALCRSSNGTLKRHGDYHLHMSCALWCPEVYYDAVNDSLMHVDEALEKYLLQPCTYCGIPGASRCCAGDGCKVCYHVECAKRAGALLIERSLKLICSKHRSRRFEC
ncbi:hypothetical protein TRVL_00897 [Trypanosoma vivax]|uniref:PHD-type domain-containing protein n=1 Tax=Trypanosoma vivax (strain Y486) TaxID=1055687 RepID=G0U2W9_TRYVY|nr:hypothetical protein TRVL_00897 [Trypanosoma vivax]CCC50623.1 conserved hypothetical protein [Trypanosoma vivax Y486]